MSGYFEPRPKSGKELKRRYKDLAKKYHPDVGGDNEIMREINKEYNELKLLYDTGCNGTENIENDLIREWKVKNDKKSVIKEIIAEIRKFVKAKFPDCKFSCTSKKHIIYISLMEAPEEVYMTSGISGGYLKNANSYLKSDKKQKTVLTEYGKMVISTIENYYNENHRYKNFYLNFDIGSCRGKCYKPFKVIKRKK